MSTTKTRIDGLFSAEPTVFWLVSQPMTLVLFLHVARRVVTQSAMRLLRELHSRLESVDDLKAIAPGTVTSTSVPCWILLQNSNFPPILLARSRMPGNP